MGVTRQTEAGGLAGHLEILGWSRRELARRLDVTESAVRKWEATRKGPAPILAWLEDLARYVSHRPPPAW